MTYEFAENYDAERELVDLEEADSSHDDHGIETDSLSEEDRLVRLNGLELCVTAVAGQINLSLKELLELKAGDAIEIGRLPAQVKLLVNNTQIALGYLVEFNGRLGVKISKIINSGYHAEI